MKVYRASLLADILMQHGMTIPSAVTERTELDEHVTALARKSLTPALRMSFFFAFGCTETLDDIVQVYSNDLEKKVDVETIRRYLRDCHKRIISASKTDPELIKYAKSLTKN